MGGKERKLMIGNRNEQTNEINKSEVSQKRKIRKPSGSRTVSIVVRIFIER